jgi:peptidoglycan/xylan/chitin deacetylase (PgdA/CDA1 family)
MALIPPRSANTWAPPAYQLTARRRGVDARRVVKHALATALSGLGVDAFIGAMFRGAAPLIVGYHRVVHDFEASARDAIPGLLVSRAMLERHLDRIGKRYRFVSLDELGDALERGDPLTRAVATVVFDDGYRDVYENAVPLLLRKGIPAAVFVVSDLIGTTHLQIHDRLFLVLRRALRTPAVLDAVVARHLDDAAVLPVQREIVAAAGDALALTRALLHALTFDHLDGLIGDLEAAVGPVSGRDDPGLWPMTWEMLADVHAKGLVVGSHTCRHALLANETPEVAARETEASRRRLEQALGAPVTHFAYPDGSFNATAVRAVAASGYRFAYTTCSHVDHERPLLTIARRMLWERSAVDATGRFAPAILDCQAQGLFAGGRECRQKTHA